jgi:hypothetical protein
MISLYLLLCCGCGCATNHTDIGDPPLKVVPAPEDMIESFTLHATHSTVMISVNTLLTLYMHVCMICLLALKLYGPKAYRARLYLLMFAMLLSCRLVLNCTHGPEQGPNGVNSAIRASPHIHHDCFLDLMTVALDETIRKLAISIQWTIALLKLPWQFLSLGVRIWLILLQPVFDKLPCSIGDRALALLLVPLSYSFV